ncbi:MAG: DUF4426 domain-containing protein [Xanthomonadales bacterium]|nr:DUF4426 domain-containing protein [Gammaproteobacteria bacterium]MBT8055130.1 DUF4426 domain-containing protein [Gammaproteobacteria bacterium]NND58381.1 DUF4426 domain-containing protein [Xanthomonadales bacterium]NNK51724.1 DUF4426 domain-containing protein [Xanthomonadales bacterium]
MKKLSAALLLLIAVCFSSACQAQQSQDFGEYVVHYNAINTNLIPPQVAQGYGIQRSSSRALLNVTVLKKVMDTPGTPVSAEISANGTNLTGQNRELDLRKVEDSGGAIYYLGVFPVHNLETYRFNIEVAIEGEPEPLVVKFTQQFYTE